MSGRIRTDRNTIVRKRLHERANEARSKGPYFWPIHLKAGHLGTVSSSSPSATARYPVSLSSTKYYGFHTQRNNIASIRGWTNYSTRFDSDRRVLVQRNADTEYKLLLRTSFHSLDLSKFVHPTSPSLRRACISQNCARTTLCFREEHNMRS